MKWFRFYHDARHDPKVRRLSDRLYRHWVNILCIASANKPRGVLPSPQDVADELRVSVSQASRVIDQLKEARLLDETRRGLSPHNWPARQPKSDDVVTRVSRYRERNRNVTGNNDVTPLARASRPISSSGSSNPDTSTGTSTKNVQPSSRKERPTISNPALAQVSQMYEQEIGALTPLVRDWLLEAVEEYSIECLGHSFAEAARYNKRSQAYVEKILKRHKAEGCYAGKAPDAEAEFLAARYERGKKGKA